MAVLPGLDGVRIGHATDLTGVTGCTVILCPGGCRAAVDVRGSAPGTRETDVLRPGNLVGMVHAVLLTGGSAFGLAAAHGVMRFLEQLGAGVPTPCGPVPIVAGAVLYDLNIGDPRARPDEAMGWAACQAAQQDGPPEEGSVGAGTGATVGKLFGPDCRMKGGLGVARAQLSDGHTVVAVVAVNALGDVYDPDTGRWLAGAFDRQAGRPLAAGRAVAQVFAAAAARREATGASGPSLLGESTTLACVLTDLPLDGADLQRVAEMAHDGLARAVRPAHTLWDGDTVFAVSTAPPQRHRPTGFPERPRPAVVSEAGAAAAEAVAQAIVRAVQQARGLGGVPAWRELPALHLP